MYVFKNASGGINPSTLKKIPYMESLTRSFNEAFVESKLPED